MPGCSWPRVEPARAACGSGSGPLRVPPPGCARPAAASAARRHRAEGRGGVLALELDRRKIRDRVSELKAELAAIEDESKTQTSGPR